MVSNDSTLVVYGLILRSIDHQSSHITENAGKSLAKVSHSVVHFVAFCLFIAGLRAPPEERGPILTLSRHLLRLTPCLRVRAYIVHNLIRERIVRTRD